MKSFLLYTNKASKAITGLLLTIILVSCEDFLEIDPPRNEIVSQSVFSSDASVTSAVRGIYSLMASSQGFANGALERYTGLSSDELSNHFANPDQQEFYLNDLLPVNGVVMSAFWREAYLYINNANSILLGLKDASLSGNVRTQLEGEARFIRAFCHFYLVNLFGAVPYITTTDYRVNASAARNTVEEVYARMLEDLLMAEQMLSGDFAFSKNNRTQPNRGAAQALLAKVYLYIGEWQKAEEYASLLINNASLYVLETDLNKVFLTDSREAIWQLEPVLPEKSTGQARLFIIASDPAIAGAGGVSLSDNLLNQFEPDDQRFSAWISSYTSGADTWYFPFKYKVYASETVTEAAAVFRLAEQYLIRAEARIHRDDFSGAIADLDVVRGRAGLPLIADTNPSASEDELLTFVEQERRVELFCEWGHRWFDLKRTERADEVLAPLKPGWETHDALYPIPQTEILVNPVLSQNPGY